MALLQAAPFSMDVLTDQIFDVLVFILLLIKIIDDVSIGLFVKQHRYSDIRFFHVILNVLVLIEGVILICYF